jgi:ABC-type Fe3+-hydroxamate transport system substrate-binding protein
LPKPSARDDSIIVLTSSIWVLALASVATFASAEIVVTDDVAKRVRLHAPATRIVALAPSLTELAFSAGA